MIRREVCTLVYNFTAECDGAGVKRRFHSNNTVDAHASLVLFDAVESPPSGNHTDPNLGYPLCRGLLFGAWRRELPLTFSRPLLVRIPEEVGSH